MPDSTNGFRRDDGSGGAVVDDLFYRVHENGIAQPCHRIELNLEIKGPSPWRDVRAYGAKGDGRLLTGLTVPDSNNKYKVVSATNQFLEADEGKTIRINGATLASDHHTVVADWISATEILLTEAMATEFTTAREGVIGSNGRPLKGLSISNGSTTLTAAAAAFSLADEGKPIRITGAVTIGRTPLSLDPWLDLYTTVATYVSATEVTLATPASRTVAEVDGTIGDGDTMAIQAALDATAEGEVLFIPTAEPGSFYYIDGILRISKGITIKGMESELRQTRIEKGLFVGIKTSTIDSFSGDVFIEKLRVIGRQRSSPHNREIGIWLNGYQSSTAPVSISNLRVRQCWFSDWGKDAVRIQDTEYVFANENVVDGVVYGGVMLLSVKNGVLTHNFIDLKDTAGDNNNAYGISATRLFSSHPVSQNIAMASNQTQNLPWVAYDTHGGVGILYCANGCLNSGWGVSMVSSLSPPKECVSFANCLSGKAVSGTQNAGLSVAGNDASDDRASGCVHAANIAVDFGNVEHKLRAGGFFHTTLGLALYSNMFIRPTTSGVNIDLWNYGFAATKNVVIDPWTKPDSGGITRGFAAGFEIMYSAPPNQKPNSGVLSLNTVKRGAMPPESGTKINQYGFYLENMPANQVVLGLNFTDAPIPISDVGGSSSSNFFATELGFACVEPTARPSNTAEIKTALASFGLLSGSGTSPLDLGGGVLNAANFASTVKPVTDNYTVGAEDGVIVATPGGTDITIMLSSPSNGRVLTIKRTGNGTGKVLVSGNGTEIDGSTANRELTGSMSLSVMGYTSKWYII